MPLMPEFSYAAVRVQCPCGGVSYFLLPTDSSYSKATGVTSFTSRPIFSEPNAQLLTLVTLPIYTIISFS
jgi:hypothetical protein